MTPFMHRVAEVIGTDAEPEDLPTPATQPSVAYAVNEGTDRQIAIRSYAEQLVCEANAVLDAQDDHLALIDEVGGSELAFTIEFRGRGARVSTRYLGGAAYGQLVGDGLGTSEPRELVGPNALPDLIMLLILESGAARHPHHS